MTSKAISELNKQLEGAVRRGKAGQTKAKNLRRRLRIQWSKAVEECAEAQENELMVLESMYPEEYERLEDVIADPESPGSEPVPVLGGQVDPEASRKLARFSLSMKPGESVTQKQVHVTALLIVTYTPGYPITELPKLEIEKERGLTAEQLKELQVIQSC